MTLHGHNETLEVYRVLRGEGVVRLKGERVMVRPGSVVTIDPGTKHMVKMVGSTPVELDVTTMPAWRQEDHHLV